MNRSFLAIFALFLTLSQLPVSMRADQVPESAPGINNSPGFSRGAGHRVESKKTVKQTASENSSKSIRGGCTILESPSNPIQGPCVNMLLILTDTKGVEVTKTRTTPQGQFEFDIETDQPYKIAAGSKFYELVSPTGDVRGGERVELALKQR